MDKAVFQKVVSNIEFGGICNYQTAKAVARSLFSKYSKGEPLGPHSLERMLIDTYKLMDKEIIPSKDDIQIYSETLDRNLDGKVTLEDLQSLAVRLLVGEKNLIKKNYAQILQGRIKVARRLFEKFDSDHNGYIIQEQIGNLLVETYKEIGMTYNPSQQDIKTMMKMADLDGDGKISMADYENLIVRSLQNCGIKIYQ